MQDYIAIVITVALILVFVIAGIQFIWANIDAFIALGIIMFIGLIVFKGLGFHF